MAINFRGTASRLKQMTEKRNPAGFQEKSSAGPRDGVGGEKVSVDEAAKKFAERKSPFKIKRSEYKTPEMLANKSKKSRKVSKEKSMKQSGSPFKMKKNFYGGEAYFSDGYGGPLKKSNPITQKSSPFKINMALVQGAADVYASQGFKDVKEDVKKGFEESKTEYPNVNVGGQEGGECPNEGDVKDADGNCGPATDDCGEGMIKDAETGECKINTELSENNDNAIIEE